MYNEWTNKVDEARKIFLSLIEHGRVITRYRAVALFRKFDDAMAFMDLVVEAGVPSSWVYLGENFDPDSPEFLYAVHFEA